MRGLVTGLETGVHGCRLETGPVVLCQGINLGAPNLLPRIARGPRTHFKMILLAAAPLWLLLRWAVAASWTPPPPSGASILVGSVGLELALDTALATGVETALDTALDTGLDTALATRTVTPKQWGRCHLPPPTAGRGISYSLYT
mgnify:CR=1 FL=1